jgi:hypothetical protein
MLFDRAIDVSIAIALITAPNSVVITRGVLDARARGA